MAPSPWLSCIPSCRAGFYCVAGHCRSACNPPCGPYSECIDHECRPNARAAAAALEGEKSPGAAFALEFFLGFGIGNYYAGSVGWGVAGTLGSIFPLAGLALMLGAGDSAGAIAGVVMLIVGVPLRLGSVIAAPVVASQHNRELRRQAGLLALAGGAPAWQAPPTAPERRLQPSTRNAVMAGVPVLAW